jgi:formate dehydrogenase major subunit
MAECHPVAFRWVMEAKARGATIIHVDPRFTRTSAVADLHVPIRPGSDIAFLGGIIRYILENERYFKEYVVEYTNAPTIIDERFKDTEELDGFFSGFDAEHNRYDWDTWSYEGVEGIIPAAGHKHAHPSEPGHGGSPAPGHDMTERHQDRTLQHPRCVFQLLKKHYARYTPELVEETCGIPKELFLQVAETLCQNSGRERTGEFVYAVGWTQHTVGVQYIRTAAIVQLLLGNMGRPGGGIMALRGHASIQGSTDIPTLYDLLPGYLPMPHASLPDEGALQAYVDNNRSATGWWSEFP